MADKVRYCSLPPSVVIEPVAVRTMNAMEFGAYTSLLIELWLADGTLEATEEELAVYSRSGRDWPKVKPKLMKLFVYADGVLSHSLIDSLKAHALNRIENARQAAAIREQKRKEREEREAREREEAEKLRQSEPETPSNDDLKKNSRSSKEKVKEKVKVNVKGKVNVKVTYSSFFNTFWEAWRKLDGIVQLNKGRAYAAWCERVKEFESEEIAAAVIMEAVALFDSYMIWREKTNDTGKRPRDFVPQPETWLNQKKFYSEYPRAFNLWNEGRTAGDKPVNGIDYWWASTGEGIMKMKIVKGMKTEEPFDEKEWKAGR